jgi:aquaporin Z
LILIFGLLFEGEFMNTGLLRKYLVEFFGAFFWVWGLTTIGNPMAAGFMLMVLCFLGSRISGGFFNPAVLLAVWLAGKIKTNDFLAYLPIHILGGFSGAIMHFWFVGYRYLPNLPIVTSKSFPKIFTVELIFTLLFCCVFLAVLKRMKMKDGVATNAFILGITLTAISFWGGTYNPAVSIGSFIFDLFYSGGAERGLMCMVGPFVGAALSPFVYKFLYPAD